MTTNEIIALILLHEGSEYTDDPADAGGPTRWGITQDVLAQFRRHPVTANDVRALTRQEAEQVYRFLYIAPFDLLPESQVKVNVIDMGVNAGVFTAVRLLQMTVGADVDGHLGEKTVKCVKERDWNVPFVGVRLHYYEALIERRPVNIKWRHGWRNRALAFVPPLQLMRSPRPLTLREQLGHARYGIMGKAYDIAA